MTIRRIRTIVNALKRKFALPLAILRLRRPAEKLCDDWAIALDQRHPPLPIHIQVNQFAKNAPRNPNYLTMHAYLERTKRQKKCPNPYDLIRTLLPQAHETGILANVLAWDPPAR